jgi:hypothetical protein
MAERYAGCLILPSEAGGTATVNAAVRDDSSQPTARGPSGTGLGNAPSLMY